MVWIFTLFALFGSSFADSIIVDNGCKEVVNKECYIELETIKGEPGADCSIFSDRQKTCQYLPTAVPISVAKNDAAGDMIDGAVPFVEENNGTTSMTWNGTNVHISVNFTRGDNSAGTHIVATSVWNSIAKEKINTVQRVPIRATRDIAGKGEIVRCNCTPVGAPTTDEKMKIKRSSSTVTALKGKESPQTNEQQVSKDCQDGFRLIGDISSPENKYQIRKAPAMKLDNCKAMCRMEMTAKCASIIYNSASFDCTLYSSIPSSVPIDSKTGASSTQYDKC